MSYSEFNLSILENHRLAYINGDNSALLEAIRHCAYYKQPLPDWAAWCFIDAHDKWRCAEVRTLDEAFKVERKKGYNINKDRKWINESFGVYIAFLGAEKQKRSITNELADEIAARFFTNRDSVYGMYKDIRENNAIGAALNSKRK